MLLWNQNGNSYFGSAAAGGHQEEASSLIPLAASAVNGRILFNFPAGITRTVQRSPQKRVRLHLRRTYVALLAFTYRLRPPIATTPHARRSCLSAVASHRSAIAAAGWKVMPSRVSSHQVRSSVDMAYVLMAGHARGSARMRAGRAVRRAGPSERRPVRCRY